MGSRVAIALRDFGVSHVQFARDHGVSRGFVSAVCRGEKYPSVELLRGLHRIGVRVGWVLVGEETEYVVPPTARVDDAPHWSDELTPAHLRAYKLVDAAAARRSLDLVEGLLLGLGVEDTRASRSRSA